MNISEAIKTSINGDEYYTLKESVDMIIPYILGGGISLFGVLLIQKKVSLLSLLNL